MAENEAQGEWALPNGWIWTTIGEVAETTSGGTPSRKHPEYYTNGTVPWVKSGELRDGIITEVEESITEEALCSSSAKVFPKGTPVVALYGATVGKTGILGIDAATNQAVCAIFALKTAFTSKFVTYWLQFQRPNLIKLSSGGAQPNISQQIIRVFPIALAPLPEQHRIVAEIETQFTRLDATVAALERAQANLRRYKAAVLKAACEGWLVPTEAELAREEGRDYEPADQLLARILAERRARWEADYLEEQRAKGKEPKDDRWKQKYKEPAPPDTENLPELPEGWVWISLDQAITLSQNGLSKRRSEEGKPTTVLRLADIVDGEKVTLENVRRIKLRDAEIEKYQLLQNDLLCIRVNGSPDLVGRVIPFRGASEPIAFCDHFIRFRPSMPELASFLTMCFHTDRIRKYVDLNKVSSAGQNTVSQGTMTAVALPFPPLTEQRRIVAEVERRLSLVAALEASVEAALARAGRLRQAVLKQAFEGRLVPQDPNDEPASVLLERIRAQREAEKKPKGKGSGKRRRETEKPQQLELF